MQTNLLVKLPPLVREISIRKNWFEERERLLADAASVRRVGSKAEFERAGAILSALSRSVNTVDAMRTKLATPFLVAAKTIKAAADSAKEPLEKARGVLRAKLSTYADSERKRKEATRLRAFATREAAEEEFRRVQQIALDSFASDTTLFNPPLPPDPQRKPASFPKAESVAVRSKLVFEIGDETKLPRGLLSPDKAKITAWIDINRDSLRERLKAEPGYSPLPGIVFKLVTEVIPR